MKMINTLCSPLPPAAGAGDGGGAGVALAAETTEKTAALTVENTKDNAAQRTDWTL